MGSCPFKGGDIPLYQGIYETAVYETKTGKKIVETVLRGRERKECPLLELRWEDEEAKVHTTPDFAELRRVLGRYVD